MALILCSVNSTEPYAIQLIKTLVHWILWYTRANLLFPGLSKITLEIPDCLTKVNISHSRQME